MSGFISLSSPPEPSLSDSNSTGSILPPSTLPSHSTSDSGMTDKESQWWLKDVEVAVRDFKICYLPLR